MSVMLVDDALMVRQRLCMFVEETRSLRVVAEAGTVAEATRLFDTVHPETVVLDLSLPDGNGIDVLQHIRDVEGECTVVVLSNHMDSEARRYCIEHGADYVFRKYDEYEQAIETLRGLSKQASRGTHSRQVSRRVHCAKLIVTSLFGLHARPAAMLVKTAHRFDADIEISHGDMKADAKSIMSVLVLAAEHGRQITVSADGPDAKEAIEAITALFGSHFNEKPSSPASKTIASNGRGH